MKKIILGITGSVAAIKTAKLAALLQTVGELRIIATEAAEYFIRSEIPALNQAAIPIYRDQDEWPLLQGAYELEAPILHIEMRRWADCLVVAPLDANTMAKVVHGICDNLLTSLIRAWDWQKPLVLCPAMNTLMWNNHPTAEQISLLQSRGAMMVPPVIKRLACNDVGMGGMAELAAIVRRVEVALEE